MPAVVYSFRAIGADACVNAYERIGKARDKAHRAQRGGAGESRAAKSPEVIAAEKAAKDLERAERQKLTSRERAQRMMARVRDRHFLDEQRKEERREKQEQQRVERAAKSAIRAEEKLASTLSATRQRAWAKEQRETERRNEKARTALRNRNAAIRGAAWDYGSAAGGAIVSGVAGAAITAGAAGVALAGAAARDRLAVRDKAVALSVNSRQAGQSSISPDELMGDATRTAKAVRGTKAIDVLGAQQQYVTATGDLDSARLHSKMFAQVARASGAAETDVANTSAALATKFGIKDQQQMKAAMAAIYQGGKSGAFEMRDSSQYMTEIAAAGERFGLDKGVSGVKTLSGLTQLSMATAGNGAKASTGVQAMMRQLLAKGGNGKEDIKALTGANVFTDGTRSKTRRVEDVLVDVISGAKGDLTKLTKVFGDEGLVGASKMISTYNQAANGTSGSAADKQAAGRAALVKLLNETIDVQGDYNDVIKDAAEATDTASAKMVSTWESVADSVGTAMLPAINAFAEEAGGIGQALVPVGEAAAEAVEALGSMLKFLQRHGVIDKPKDPALEVETRPGAALNKLASEEQAILATGAQGPAAKKKLREIRAKRGDLMDQINDPNNPWKVEKFRNGTGDNDFVYNDLADTDFDLQKQEEEIKKKRAGRNQKGLEANGPWGSAIATAVGGDWLKDYTNTAYTSSLMMANAGLPQGYKINDSRETFDKANNPNQTSFDRNGSDSSASTIQALIPVLMANTAATQANTAATSSGGGAKPGSPVFSTRVAGAKGK